MIPCAWEVVVPSEVCSDWNNYPQTTKDTALWLASTYLWAATGRRFGICPVTVRPTQNRTPEPAAYQDFGASPAGGPILYNGRWFNQSCSTWCCGEATCAVVLRGPVAEVTEVLVDGTVVPGSAYRVDVAGGAYLLVRTDGKCWPACQNFTRATDQMGTFEVTYGRGQALPEALAIATAMLACQYGRFLSTGTCKLPARMTRLSRQGVEVQVEPPEPDGQSTGIREVDTVVNALNPSGRQRPPVLLSPDLPENCDRMTVWTGGS